MTVCINGKKPRRWRSELERWPRSEIESQLRQI